MGETGGEIPQVVGHGRTLCGAVEAQTRNGEVFVGDNVVGDVTQGVALAAQGECVERIGHRHVGVERIVARHDHFFGVGIVDRCGEFHLGGEELTGIEIGRHRILIEVVVAALADGFFESAETIGFSMSREIDVGQVGQLDIELALCRPSSFVGEVLETQFIGPHFDAAHTARIVAQTDHHRADVAQRRVALHADLVFRALRVVFIVEGGIGGQSLCAFAVTRLFDVRELLEVDVDHVVGRPHRTTSRSPGVATFGRQHQRDFIFVEVVFVVRSKS